MQITILARFLLLPNLPAVHYPLITVEDGCVLSVEELSADAFELTPATYRYLEATLSSPYLDIHMHGAAGHDVMEGTPIALDAIGRFLAMHGVGAYLPTTITLSEEDTVRALASMSHEIGHFRTSDVARATPLGIHLEGPFLSRDKRGVHRAALLQAPSIAGFERMWQAAEGRILLMTIAPELPGAVELIEYASRLGVRCSLGHSNATADEAHKGTEAGAVSATHTFNAMRSIDHRDPGLAAYVLDNDALYAELIADGFHVDPIMVRLFLKAKGEGRIILVTDGISASGMPDGRYLLGDMEVDVLEGRCTSGGTIAGSVLTLDQGVRNFMDFTGSTLETAVRAASRNPATLIGRQDTWSGIEAGRPANISVLSSRGHVIETFLQGRPVHGEK